MLSAANFVVCLHVKSSWHIFGLWRYWLICDLKGMPEHCHYVS